MGGQVTLARHARLRKPGVKEKPMLGIYIHIPFCRILCPYCDFVKKRPKQSDWDVFTEALCREIGAHEGAETVGAIFFGGGTPSMLPVACFEQIFAVLDRRFNLIEPEISIEANPEDVTEERTEAWKALGVNRISVGVQSFDDRALHYLGRGHDASTAHRACEIIGKTFKNWNIDLIFGVHPLDSWVKTVQDCGVHGSPHVSAYGLTYEPRTPFYTRREEAAPDAVYLEQYWMVDRLLPHVRRYEVSNLAMPGFESRHNLIYWRNEAYAGFGPGAYSFLNGVRARNHPAWRRYMAEPGVKSEALPLSKPEIQVETVIQALRLAEGLSASRYERRFGTSVFEDFADALTTLQARGLVECSEGRIRPTRKGFEFNNDIGLELVEALAFDQTGL